jgi:hypothetical protein
LRVAGAIRKIAHGFELAGVAHLEMQTSMVPSL